MLCSGTPNVSESQIQYELSLALVLAGRDTEQSRVLILAALLMTAYVYNVDHGLSYLCGILEGNCSNVKSPLSHLPVVDEVYICTLNIETVPLP